MFSEKYADVFLKNMCLKFFHAFVPVFFKRS